REVENNLKLLEEFSFFPEDLSILQLASARSFLGRVESEKFPPFRKSLESEKEQVVLYAQDSGKMTHLAIVVSPKFPSHALATAVQAQGVSLEPVPQLKGKPADLLVSQKQVHSEQKAELAKIDQELAGISAANYQFIAGAEEQLEIENKK